MLAAACGGSDSGSTKAAKNAAALDFVPKDALGYVTFDTDFGGDNWTKASELATAIKPDLKSVEDQIVESATSDDSDVDWKKDVEPWLGESAGAALLDMKADGGADAFIWVEVKDRSALESFAKDQGGKKGDKVGDFTVWTNKDDSSVVGVSDDLAILTDDTATLKKVVEYDGDSIKDVDGVSDAIDGVDGDALATFVVSGDGVRAAAKDNEQLKGVAEADQLKDFDALAASVSAKDDGFRIEGMEVSASEGTAENVDHPIFNDLPASTVLAVGGYNLGGVVDSALESFGKDNAQVQQGVGAISAVLGVDTKDLAKALDGEFALALSADDQGLGAVVGSAAGAAMGGGGLSGVDPAGVLKAGTLLLAFEETGTTGETLGKIGGSAGALTGSPAAPKTGTAGDFKTSTMNVQGLPVTMAMSDDVAAVSLGLDVFSTWGDDTLADYAPFKDAWSAADAPDKSVSTMWLDTGRIAKLAGLTGSDKAQLGGMVGWSKDDGKKYEFGAFLHITDGSKS